MSQQNETTNVGSATLFTANQLIHTAIAAVQEGGDYAKAKNILNQVVILSCPKTLEMALSLDLLGTLCLRAGFITEARRFLQKSLNIKRGIDSLKNSTPTIAATLYVLAAALRAEKADSQDAKDLEAEAEGLMDAFWNS